MKPAIEFRALRPADFANFQAHTGNFCGPDFGGIVAFCRQSYPYGEIIMGMVGLDRWTKTSVNVHWYIRHPRCLLPLWNELVGYLSLWRKKKMLGFTPANNNRTLRVIFRKLGWREIGRIADGWDDGVDLVISEYIIPCAAVGAEDGVEDGRKKRA